PVSPPSPPAPLLAPSLYAAPPPPEIYTLPLHDALPISGSHETFPRTTWRSLATSNPSSPGHPHPAPTGTTVRGSAGAPPESGLEDRKSTRLNSSHVSISYAVFCLKKKITTSYESLREHD